MRGVGVARGTRREPMGRKGGRKMNWVEWIFAIVTLTFLGFLIVLPVYVVVHNILALPGFAGEKAMIFGKQITMLDR